MALLLENDSSPLQKFMAKNEKPLSSMPVHVCPETGGGYIQWSDIQFTFVGIDHLEYQNKVMVLFMIDSEGDLYVLPFFCMCA